MTSTIPLSSTLSLLSAQATRSLAMAAPAQPVMSPAFRQVAERKAKMVCDLGLCPLGHGNERLSLRCLRWCACVCSAGGMKRCLILSHVPVSL
jgi:hypothetical protein